MAFYWIQKPNIIKKYFSELTQEEQDNIVKSTDEFELTMSFHEIPGALKFVDELKANGLKVGLVTSSMQTKLDAVNKVQHFDKIFDAIVSGDRVVLGKPNPECFLLAAKDLGVKPENCIVFEDSFAGIEAGKAAGMFVIGLSTTHPADQVKEKTSVIISNFNDFNLEKLKSLI